MDQQTSTVAVLFQESLHCISLSEIRPMSQFPEFKSYSFEKYTSNMRHAFFTSDSFVVQGYSCIAKISVLMRNTKLFTKEHLQTARSKKLL